MPDRSLLTPVPDNSLLPFGTTRISSDVRRESQPFDLTPIFENGMRLGNQTYDRLRIDPDGTVHLYNAALQDAATASPNLNLPNPRAVIPISDNSRTRLDVIEPTDTTSGVFFDLNTERDSVVVTLNEVPRQVYVPGITPAEFPRATAQLEFLDTGDGNFEVIWRFSDIDANAGGRTYINAVGFNVGPSGYHTVFYPQGLDGSPSDEMDTNLGNTGVVGVYQMRIIDGQLQPIDFTGDTITGADDAGDLITGTSRGDLIGGRGGDDTIISGYGNDSLYGGLGNDSFFAAGGNNQVTGADGDDTITLGDGFAAFDQTGQRTLPAQIVDAGAGNDSITTGNQADSIDAGEGNNIINAGGGDNTITAGSGNDQIFTGGRGGNLIMAGAGDDEITGGSLSDSIDGGTGASTVRSGEGNDTITTHDEADFVNAGNGSNFIQTFLGDDTIRVGGAGNSTVQAGAGDDLIDGSFVEAPQYFWRYDGTGVFASGQDGEDTLIGTNFGDTLAGQDDNDSILSGSGEDEVHGGAGDDVLAGGYGNDRMFGGDGDDFIFTSLGADTVVGGAGADRFYSSGLERDFMHIIDYNPDEGDRLVMDNRLFDPEDFELRYLTALTVNGPVYRQIQLGWQAEDGYRGLFTFQNEPDIDQILLRLSSPEGVDLVRFDLIPL